MKRRCPTCRAEYDDGGNAWTKMCYDCYKNFRYSKRIQKLGWKSDVYLAHPTVTKEELDAWIKANGHEVGWGAEQFDPAKTNLKVWTNSTNYD